MCLDNVGSVYINVWQLVTVSKNQEIIKNIYINGAQVKFVQFINWEFEFLF